MVPCFQRIIFGIRFRGNPNAGCGHLMKRGGKTVGETLLRRFANGDREAFGRLVERYIGGVYNIAFRLLGNAADAEDATQETFLQLAKVAGRFRGGSERAFVYGVAARCGLHMLRASRRRHARERRYVMVKRNQQEPLDKETRRLMEEALGCLPPKLRAVVVLRFIEGLSSTETAKALSIREGTVKSRTNRALKRMRRYLAEHGLATTVPETLLASLPPVLPPSHLISLCKTAVTLTKPAVKLSLGGLMMGVKTKIGVTAAIVLVAVLLLYLFSSGLWGRLRVAKYSSTPAVTPEKTPKETENAKTEPDKEPQQQHSAQTSRPPSTEQQTQQAEPTRPQAQEPEEREEEVELVLPDGRRVRVKKGRVKGPKIKSGGRKWRPVPSRSKWAPIPRPKGDCVVSGTVLDGDGKPVAGAFVLAIRPDSPQRDGMVSYTHIRRVATTDQNGAFKGNVPHGRWLLAANHKNLLNGRWGFKLNQAKTVEVTLQEKEQRADITLTLPFSLSSLCSVSGTVVDKSGNPMPYVSVSCDYQVTKTDKDGRFTFEGLTAGRKSIRANPHYGYKSASITVDLQPGEKLDNVVIRVELAEKGEFSVSGTVKDEEGNPVEGATIYLNTRRRTHRRAFTDKEGKYRLENIKERKVQVQVYKRGYVPALREVELPAEGVDFVLRRRVRITLTILDAATGLPVKRFNVSVYKLLENGKRVHTYSMSRYSEKGQATFGAEPVDIVVVVEAPGYKKAEFTLNVPQQESWQQNLGLEPAPADK